MRSPLLSASNARAHSPGNALFRAAHAHKASHSSHSPSFEQIEQQTAKNRIAARRLRHNARKISTLRPGASSLISQHRSRKAAPTSTYAYPQPLAITAASLRFTCDFPQIQPKFALQEVARQLPIRKNKAVGKQGCKALEDYGLALRETHQKNRCQTYRKSWCKAHWKSWCQA